MNTGFLGPAVATVLTVYGIETSLYILLQSLVLPVATVLTVYGIETSLTVFLVVRIHWKVATVLTVYGIETSLTVFLVVRIHWKVATVLTVYGIETQIDELCKICHWVATVLTVYGIETRSHYTLWWVGSRLQQYLPFTVLKLFQIRHCLYRYYI